MSFGTVRIDTTTGVIGQVPYEHLEVHTGRLFSYSECVELGNDASVDYVIETPDTTRWSHIGINIEGVGVTEIRLYEATNGTGTTEQTNVFNRQRNSANTAGTKIYKGYTAAGEAPTLGTLLCSHRSGFSSGQSKSASEAGSAHEYVLKQNTKYILRITSRTAANFVATELNWYEHQNR
jgi:hypothetical protein